MIVLTSTDKLLLQLYQDNSQVQVHVSYIDWLGSIATPGSRNTNVILNANQTVDIVLAPAAGVIRAVEYMGIYNISTFFNFNIFYIDNIVNMYICIGALQPNESTIYTTYSGWQSFTVSSGLRELQPAVSNTVQGNLAGVAVNSWKYYGLGFQFILRNSPNILIEVSCVMISTVANGQCYLALAYGTGTPPTNGQSYSSGAFTITYVLVNTSYVVFPTMVLEGILSGLTIGTLYWVDVICYNPTNTGSAGLQIPNCVCLEI